MGEWQGCIGGSANQVWARASSGGMAGVYMGERHSGGVGGFVVGFKYGVLPGQELLAAPAGGF